MKKIAICLPSMNGGGAERIMMILANGFAARGMDVDLVLSQATGPYLESIDGRVHVVDLGSSRVMKSFPGLVRYLRSIRPAAILSALDYANIVTLLARIVARVPSRVVISERCAIKAMYEQNMTFRRQTIYRLIRLTYHLADAVVAVSDGVRAEILELTGVSPDRAHTIYNPIVDDALMAMSMEAVDHPWFASGGLPVLLAVGRLSEQKDYATLIRAFARVVRKRECRLIILGDGEQRAALESLINELGLAGRIQLPGFQRNPFAWMRMASAFVLSSRFEGLPNVLIQAMACGTPVVSTDCPSGPHEILEGGRWGRLVPVGDPAALAGSIIATLDDPTPRAAKARASYFSADRAIDSYLKIIFDDNPRHADIESFDAKGH